MEDKHVETRIINEVDQLLQASGVGYSFDTTPRARMEPIGYIKTSCMLATALLKIS